MRKVSDEMTRIELNEGFSTDEEENQTDENVFKQKRGTLDKKLFEIEYLWKFSIFKKFLI